MKKGFTLVELLIVIGVFGILMVAGTDFLIQVVRNGNQAAVQNEVRQNASKIMQDISASIRNSSCVTWDNWYSWVFLTTYSDNCVTVADQYKFVFDPRFSPDPLKPTNYMDISGKVLKKVGVSGTENLISSNGVAVIVCTDANHCGATANTCGIGVTFTGTKLTNKAVKIDLVVQATTSAARGDFCGVIKLSDTITPRGQF